MNLTDAELARLCEARRFAWIRRKFLAGRRYRRQYLRVLQARYRERGQFAGWWSFKGFCKAHANGWISEPRPATFPVGSDTLL
jgi:hypothetical protein